MGLNKVLITMLSFFSKKRIPREEFENCVFRCLEQKISNKKAVESDLKSIRLLSTLSSSRPRAKETARLYRKVEEHVSREQPKHRISKENLREHIFSTCHPERAEGDFAFLFLPSSFQKLKLIEEFTTLLFSRSRGYLGEDGYVHLLRSIQSKNDFTGILKKDAFDWSSLERMVREDLKTGIKRAERIVSSLLSRLTKALSKSIGNLRTEKLFRDTYREFCERFDFLEDEVPNVLLILPKEFLEQERVAMLPKARLQEEVKERAQKLEYTLGELKEEKQKLARALEELRAVDRAKGDFIAVISHQFRTPLSVIRWSAELLGEEISRLTLKESERLRRPTSDIYAKSIFLIRILQDIYDVLAIEGNVSVIEQRPNQLWEIVSDVLRRLDKEAKQKHVALVFDRTDVPLKELSLDRTKISRAVEILIRNAVQYTPENGKVTVTIQSTMYHEKPAIACVIRDTGIGIKKEDIPKIFSKFFRSKNAIQTIPDGAGLGLYLVKNFIEAHNGSVNVESEVGKGTSFTFVLPQE